MTKGQIWLELYSMHPLQKIKFPWCSRNLRCESIKPNLIAIDSRPRDSFYHGLKLLPMPNFYNLLLLIITPHLIAVVWQQIQHA